VGMISIWDGEDLPPVGCDVHYEVASEPGAFRGKVTGYKIAPPLRGEKHYHRIFINMDCESSDGREPYKMQRMLGDVHPLTWRPD
jgi:hypothetical protein